MPVAPNRYEISPDAGLGFQAYEISSGTGGTANVGWLLAVADEDVTVNGYTFSADTDYWWWNNGWPTSSFNLQRGSLPGSKTPSNVTSSYPSQDFPNTTSDYTPGTGGTWFKIKKNSGLIGWLDHRSTENDWYAYAENGTVPKRFHISATETLVFDHQSSSPSSIDDASKITETENS